MSEAMSMTEDERTSEAGSGAEYCSASVASMVLMMKADCEYPDREQAAVVGEGILCRIAHWWHRYTTRSCPGEGGGSAEDKGAGLGQREYRCVKAPYTCVIKCKCVGEVSGAVIGTLSDCHVGSVVRSGGYYTGNDRRDVKVP
eukprot:gnl/Dysnectes_brevis/10575_a21127_162.p1 GENE.gnl/Dysnectes_brevis/10575_a21127_162~~gnl/Dysnectes_brevis/10575_a21127_162.p1  ORF type:complete len:143 (-),score=3.00 gnl/Dysnectes_brevis/10575_a21127_162:384-812(-)